VSAINARMFAGQEKFESIFVCAWIREELKTICSL